MRPMKVRWLAPLIGLVWLAMPTPAFALLCGTFLNPMQVTTANVAFGTYNPGLATDDTATGGVTIRCALLGIDLLPNFSVALSQGHSASYAQRFMIMGANHLNYNIYTASGVGQPIWGDGNNGTQVRTFSTLLLLGTLTFQAHSIAPTHQFVTPGPYSDTITVVVTY